MGLFSKKSADGLPDKVVDLWNEALWPKKKHDGDMEYHFRVSKKAVDLMVEQYHNGKLRGGEDGDLGMLDDCASALRTCYEKGLGCPVNPEGAFACVKTEADILASFSQNHQITDKQAGSLVLLWKILAGYYASGYGCGKNETEALKLIRMAYDFYARGGDQYGVHRKGLLKDMIGGWPWPVQIKEVKLRALELMLTAGADAYNAGAEILQDVELLEAMDWQKLGLDKQSDVQVFQDAAQRGNPYAAYCLARCYRTGKGVQRDYMKAFEYAEKASETLLSAAEDISFICNDAAESCTDKNLARNIKSRGAAATDRTTALRGVLRSKYTKDYLSRAYHAVRNGQP